MRTNPFLFAALLALAACGGKKTADTTPAPGTDTVGTEMKAPLYDRLGKTEGITKVVELFVTNVGNNKEINARFAKSDLKLLKEKLVLQICEATGGPCKYEGVHKDMKTTHTGMKITEAEFTSMVNDLVAALNTAGVPKPEQDELLGALSKMKPDIVGI
ncbi:MAG TPA: group 1 truncated hemoglobin [Kofleriaceae bacterium]